MLFEIAPFLDNGGPPGNGVDTGRTTPDDDSAVNGRHGLPAAAVTNRKMGDLPRVTDFYQIIRVERL